MQLPFPLRRVLAKLRFKPRSRLARFAVLFLALEVLLYLLQRVELAFGSSGAGALGVWIALLTVTNVILFGILGLRWFRNVALWRLRNRLVVTYVFIGVIPVVLIAIMALIAGYLFAGQFAALLARNDIDSEINALQAVNATIAAELEATVREGGEVSENTVNAVLSGAKSQFAHIEVRAWYKGKPLVTKSEKKEALVITLPAWAAGSFAGAVLDDQKFYLRAAATNGTSGSPLMVISSLPLDEDTLTGISRNIGQIRVLAGTETIHTNINLEISDSDVESGQKILANARPITGGSLPAPKGALDKRVTFGAPLPFRDWSNGDEGRVLMQVTTLNSILYERLFSTYSPLAEGIRAVLFALTLFFAILELFALIIGLGLTRTITRSVAALYHGTQWVNRGEFNQRIVVRSRDQLAALEGSFNSMMASLEKLIAEQKEKQRMESELAIAQEVQGQLFPRGDLRLRTLELHGVCRPARTVSGDYYDFLGLGPERLALAVGDISGKGISAALLMATIHSAVRVYELGGIPDEKVLGAAGVVALSASRSQQGISGGNFRNTNGGGIHSPNEVMWLLNRHLFHSTPAEKYATLFLAIYDGDSRKLSYTNAGHLAPIVLSPEGNVRRLDVGGTVIGLFEEASYEQASVELAGGELLIAYSDGITEPENEFGEFGEAHLLEVLRENQNLPLPRLSEAVITAVTDWTGGGEQPDDITLVLARAN